MLFNSVEFLFLFLPIVLIVYYLLPHKQQNTFLVLASCFFYACWDWRFLLPLLCTTGLDYWIAGKLEASHKAKGPEAERKRLVWISVVSNLSLLGFFKYCNFFIESASALLTALGFEVSVQTLNIVLPVAISFYTFQALSYTIDVYRGELHPSGTFWDFFLGVLYFPHLVAGPIQRASSLLPQVLNPRHTTRQQWEDGLHLIMWGFFKKVFLADNLAPIADQVFSKPDPTGGEVVVGVLAFTFQIYGDFSGYTDIARGIAKIMGFEFTLNFNLPYFATNPSDFWRRWHISLSQWLRDYLYKSVGGNRGGTLLTYRNLMITMVLGGLWHGAAWNFVLWGFYHGSLLCIHRYLSPTLDRIEQAIPLPKAIWTALHIACMFAMTCYGWLLFRATSLDQIVHMTGALLQPLAGLDTATLQRIGLFVLPLAMVQWLQWRSGELQFMRLSVIPGWVKPMLYAGMFYAAVFLGGTPQSFVYFQF
jgi:D-alanyl-lipoteichoic acid acyltransferase DltB (MBOAT superfamily)